MSSVPKGPRSPRLAAAPGSAAALPGDAMVFRAAADALAGRCSGLRLFSFFLGAAFIAAVAHVDPGTVVSDMAAGAEEGFVWVAVGAALVNLTMLVIALNTGLPVLTFGG